MEYVVWTLNCVAFECYSRYGNVLCFAKWIPSLDVLNAAQSGAQSVNLVKQVEYIVSLMKNNTNVDIEKDWKVRFLVSSLPVAFGL